MSDKEDYYRLKSEELRRTQRVREEDKFKKQGTDVILVGIIAAIALSLSLFLVAPGALTVVMLASDLGISNTLTNYWALAAIISSVLFALIALASKNLKKGAIIYVALCTAITLTSLRINTPDSRTAFKAAAEEFWPLKNYIPLLERRETSKEKAHLGEKQDAKPQEAKKTNEDVVPPPQGAESNVESTDEFIADASIVDMNMAEPKADSDIASISQPRNEGPSFDCAKASFPAEKIVCDHQDLAKLDRELSQAYKWLLANNPPDSLKQQQIAWIKNSLRACNDADCVREALTKRISDLSSLRNASTLP